jgi:L-fuconolactonase
MKIDAHQHFWMYSAEQYDWIGEEMGKLKKDFLPQDLKPLLQGQGIDGSIAVQARQDLEETRWLLQLAAENELVKGVVGWVDLCSPELTAQLDEFAKHPKFVGVRHIVQGEPDDEFMLRAEFRRGIGRIADYGLTYDLLLYPRHLPIAVKLVRDFPAQRFVLDHIAKPLIAEGITKPWDEEIRELAKCENVSCKVSGMVTEARWKHWRLTDFRPYLDVVFDAFGPDRLMMGSDWPVCTLSASYAETLQIVADYAGQFSAKERAGFFGANCKRFYGIE